MGKTIKMTNETFIARAIAKHGGDKYGYDRVDYVNSKTKVEILCKNCGKHFLQAPSKHLSGQGCPKAPCGGQGKYTQEEFIEAAIKKHGTKYGYDMAIYIASKEKIEIFCYECNAYFWQVAGLHLRHGCLKCSERENGLKRRIGFDKFKELAVEKHGDRYKYDKVIFKTVKDKIEIFCTVCGKYFWQEAHSHSRGDGCPCNRGEPLTLETFKAKAKKIHGDKYNYGSVNFKNNGTKIKILCNNCEQHFMQSPSRHISGQGCPKSSCGGTQKLTHDDFVQKGMKKFGGHYEYIDKYINSQTKIKIKCTVCGNINNIAPNTHLSSETGGCSFCYGGAQSNTSDFIRKAHKSHKSGHYNYDKFTYISAKTKGIIHCKIHNEYFACAPYNHLAGFDKDGNIVRKGKGCPICGREITTAASTKSFETFLHQAREIHGNAYNYDKESYNGVKNKMNIYCQEHGLFRQDPDSHINAAHGCPVCKSSHGEKLVRSALIDAGMNFDSQYALEMCKNIRKLPFDFAVLTTGNELKGLIEFHGQQHYEPIEYYGGEDAFFELNRNDQIKADFCELNKIPFLVISYKDIKIIQKIINEFLSSIKRKKPILYFCESSQLNMFQVNT